MHDQQILPDATNLNTHLRIGNVRGEERPRKRPPSAPGIPRYQGPGVLKIGLVASRQGRMQLRFQVLGALIGFKYRIVVQHVDVLLLQEQEISFSPIDDSAPNVITADLAIVDSTKSDLFRFVIQVFDLQGGLSKEMAMLAARDVSIPLLKREHT